MTSSRSALTRATVSSGLTGLVGQLALIPSGVIMARALGVEGRGYLALVMLVPFVLAQYGSLGLPVASTYLLARDPRAFGGLVKALAFPALLQAVALTAAHGLIVVLLFADDGRDVWVAAFVSLGAVPASLAMQYGLAFLQGRSRFTAFNLLRLAPVVVYAAAVGALALAGAAGLVELTVAWVATNALVGTVTLGYAVATTPRGERVEVERGELLRYGSTGMLGATSPVEGLRLDQVVAGLLLSPAALGVYVVGAALMNLPRFLAQSVGMVAFPVTAGRSGGGGAYVRLTIAVMLTIGFALELAAGRLVPFFFGDDFAGSVPVARILVAAAVVFGIRRVLIDVTLGAGRPLAGTVSEFVAAGALVAAMALLVPPFGVEGVAGAVVVGALASLAMLVVPRPRAARVALRLRAVGMHILAAAAIVALAAALTRAPEAVGLVTAAGALAAGLAAAVATRVSLRAVATISLYCAAATLAWNDVRLTGSVTVSDGFLVVAGLCLAGSLRGRGDLRPGLRTFGVALVATGGLLGAAAADELASAAGSYLRLVLGVAGTLALFAVWHPRRIEIARFAGIWVASACVSALWALEGSLSGSLRPAGLTTHSNHFALVAALALGPALAFAASGPARRRLTGLAAAGLLGVGVLVSGSRSGLLAFTVVAFLVLAWLGSRRLVLAAGLVLVLFAALVQTGQVSLPQENALERAVATSDRSVYLSDAFRSESRRQTLELIEEHPLTGAGFHHALLAHNVYFQLLVIGGPLALAGFAVIAAGSVSGLRRVGRSVRERRGHALAAGLAAAFAGFLVGGAYQNALWDRYIWVTAALAAVAAAVPARRAATRPEPAPLVPLTARSRS